MCYLFVCLFRAGKVIGPWQCIDHATGEALPAEPFSLKTRGVSARSNHRGIILEAVDAQSLTPGLPGVVSELNVELSGILSISSLSWLLVAWPPKLAMAVSAMVVRPALCFLLIDHATGEVLTAEPFSLKTRGVSVRSNQTPILSRTVDSQSLIPRLSGAVSELNVKLSGILSISFLTSLLVAWPKLAIAVSASVLTPGCIPL